LPVRERVIVGQELEATPNNAGRNYSVTEADLAWG
jgi:hypothetical protein